MRDPAGDLGLLLCSGPAELPWLEGLAASLQSRVPALRVLAGSGLCGRVERARVWAGEHRLGALVVGACGPGCTDLLREAGTRVEIHPFDLHTVALHRSRSPCHAEALLWGKLSRALAREPVPPESVKTRPLRGPVSRRALFTSFLGSAASPVPTVDRPRCRIRQGCRRCVVSCPVGALSAGPVVELDRSRCEGCGLCIKACPAEALRLPGHGWRQILAEIDGVLSIPDGPKVPLFHCQDGSPGDLPAGAFRVEVPCVGMLPSWLLLRVIAGGAVGAMILPGGERCGGWHQDARLSCEVSAAGVILDLLGLEPDRIQVVTTAAELPAIAERLAILVPIPRSREPEEAAQAGSSRLAALVVAMAASAGSRPGERRSSEEIPFGLVAINRARCTLCGVCASLCPTAALAYSEEPDRAALSFDPRRCDGCRACTGGCPEKALAVSRVLDLDALSSPPRQIVETEMAHCRRCERAFAPLRLCQRVQERLARGNGATDRLAGLAGYCPACRIAVASRPAVAARP